MSDEYSSIKFCEVDCLEIDWGRLRVWGVIRARVICPPTAFYHPSPFSSCPPPQSPHSLFLPKLSFDLPSSSSISVFYFSVCLRIDLFCHCIMPFAFYWVLQHFSTMFLNLLLPSQCQSNLRPKCEWQSSNSRRTWGSRSCNCRRSTWRRSWCCLAHFPDFLPSVDEVQLSTKITFNYHLWLQGWSWIQFPVN